MVALIWRHVAPLWLLQILTGALALIIYDWRGVAVALSLCYIALALGSARSFRQEGARLGWRAPMAALVVALLWQLPALLGSINQMREQWGLTPYDGNSDLFDFAMQTWQMALMPLLGLFPGRGADQLAGYYLGLTVAPVLLGLLYLGVAAWPRARGTFTSFHRASPDG